MHQGPLLADQSDAVKQRQVGLVHHNKYYLTIDKIRRTAGKCAKIHCSIQII
jgi:hypothetical protein